MNDDLTILASAYLDGTATSDQRAQVESNEDLLAEVERQRLVRALLADADPPSISLREQHLAAALGAWDRLPETERVAAIRDTTPSGLDPATAAAAATISTPPPTSLADRRRSKSTGWIIGVAAVLALVVAGGVVLQSISLGSDDDSASSAIVATDDTVPEPNSSTAIAGDAAEELQRDLESSAGAATAASDTASDEIETDAAFAEEEGGFDIDPEAPPQGSDLEMLSTREQLGIFASDAIGAPISPSFPVSTDAASAPESNDGDLSVAEQAIEAFEFPLCGGADYVVGPAEYRGEPVVVGVDESLNLAIAYRALDCRVIVRASLP
ncbi:MAG: hypothetical protein DRJ50_05070 [Actinobacteria bacterium]|nr:MAG: hypothetical protein DRJ50_05070 [Actinomycetota bacterium]